MKSKDRPCVGDEAWFVEWCDKLAFYDDEEKSIDRDNCRYRTRRFTTQEEAMTFAKQVWPETKDKLGGVLIWPAEFRAYDEDDEARYPHVGFWDATDDGEWYDGPEL